MTVSPYTPAFASAIPVRTLTFGQDSKKQESVQQALEAPKADPAPHRGRKNLRYALVAGLGALGFMWGPAGIAHHTANGINQLKDSVPIVQTVTNPAGDVIDHIDKANEAVRSLPATGWIEDQWLLLMKWEMLALSLAALPGVRRKSIKPNEIYADLHKQGITGEGVKVGVVDSGYRKVWHQKGNSVKFYSPDDLTKEAKPFDTVGHGTAVRNIIADGAPDADFVVVAYATPKQEKQMKKDLAALLKKAKTDPDSLTLMEVRKTFLPLIENIAKGVKHCADQGCQVVNVSLSVEQAVQMTLMTNIMTTIAEMGIKKVFTGSRKKNTPEYKQQMANYKKLTGKLVRLKEANEETETITTELKTLYQPWLDALDYAQQKGTMVHLASGNFGGHNNAKPNTIGNINLLAAWEHPTLMVVGSTDYEGNISSFSSEFNDEIHPDLAANGSGEISTRIAPPSRGMLSKVLSPTAGLQQMVSQLYQTVAYQAISESSVSTGMRSMMKYENPQGTSFAAPDSALLNVMMLAARMKSVNPGMTLDEIRDTMIAAAEQAQFSPAQLKKIRKEVVKRLEKAQKDTNQLRTEFGAAVKSIQDGASEVIIMNGSFKVARDGEDLIMSKTTGTNSKALRVAIKDADSPEEQDTLVDILDVFYFQTSKPNLPSMTGQDDFKKFSKTTVVAPSETDIQNELDAEQKRRVGSGTISSNRRKAIELALKNGGGFTKVAPASSTEEKPAEAAGTEATTSETALEATEAEKPKTAEAEPDKTDKA